MIYHESFSSDCAVLEVGCYLKRWVSSQWTNADDYYGVIDGKLSDGTYCYVVSGGIITQKDPCSATLTVRYEADTFTAELSDALSTTITISQTTLDVTGYDDVACTSLSGESDTGTGNIVINPGSTIVNVAGSFGMTTNSTHYKFNGQLSVNTGSGAVLRYDGENFLVGPTSLTIYFAQTCQTYYD